MLTEIKLLPSHRDCETDALTSGKKELIWLTRLSHVGTLRGLNIMIRMSPKLLKSVFSSDLYSPKLIVLYEMHARRILSRFS